MSALSVAKSKITGKTFGKRLQSARKAARNKDNTGSMTQQELADAVGVHRVTLAEYESDTTIPSVEVAWKLADALGVSLDELRGTGKEKPTSNE